MASHIYPNQPLNEVVAEVKFKGNLKIEHVRADYQNDVRQDYPVLMVPHAQSGVAPTLQPFRFERDDGSSGIQLAINSLSYFSRSYLGHKQFLAEFEKASLRLIELIGPLDVTRVGWRYVNAIPFARDGQMLPLDKYFRENRVFGSALHDSLTSISSRISMPLKDNVQLNLRLESVLAGEETDVEAFLLDIDAFELHDPPSSMKVDSVNSEVKLLHDEANSIFEEMITEGYRDFLSGDAQ